MTPMSSPTITVLMPVYNAEKYLHWCITSLLNQTFTDFELLVIDDGCTDGSCAVIQGFDDPRIRLVHNDGNMGLVKTLSRGLELARGEFIARMDADDFSLPSRLEKQLALMRENPSMGICGCSFCMFGDNQPDQVVLRHTDPGYLRAHAFFTCTLLHPTWFMRRSMLEKHGLTYRERYSDFSEDDDLLLRASACFDLGNVREVLFYYRQLPTSYSSSRKKRGKRMALRLMEDRLQLLGQTPTAELLELMHPLFNDEPLRDLDEARRASRGLSLLVDWNRQCGLYNEDDFEQAAADKWYRCCYDGHRLGTRLYRLYHRHHGHSMVRLPNRREAKFFLKCLRRRRSST